MAEPGGSALHGGHWTTPDVNSGERDMSKVDPVEQRNAQLKQTTGLPTEARYWQTPATDSFRSRGGDRKDEMGLDQQARSHWPTPTTEIDQGEASERNRRTPSLSSAALWMTPSVSNSQGNEYTRDRGQEGQERLTLTGQSQHWTTPTAGNGGPNSNRDQRGNVGANLQEQASQWPSPNVQDAEAAGGRGAIDRGTRGETLHTMSTQWPTPASRDFRTPNSQESQESRTIHGGEQLPNFVEHHFSHPVLSTLDGRELSLPPPGFPLPLHLMTVSDDSTQDLPSGSWDGQSDGRRT